MPAKLVLPAPLHHFGHNPKEHNITLFQPGMKIKHLSQGHTQASEEMGINEKHLLSFHPRLDIQDWNQPQIPNWL